MAGDIATSARVDGARRRKRAVRLSTGDRIAMTVMVGVPVLLTGALIWFPTISSIGLSFTNWDGIGGVHTIQWTGTTNYRQIATIYPPFWPAFRHNLYLARRARVRRDAARDVPRLPARQADPGLAVLPEHLLHPGGDRARDHRPHLRAHPLAAAGPGQQPLRRPAARSRDRLAREPEPQPLGRARPRLLAPRELRDDHLSRRTQGSRSDAPRGRGDRRRERDAHVLQGRPARA